MSDWNRSMFLVAHRSVCIILFNLRWHPQQGLLDIRYLFCYPVGRIIIHRFGVVLHGHCTAPLLDRVMMRWLPLYYSTVSCRMTTRTKVRHDSGLQGDLTSTPLMEIFVVLLCLGVFFLDTTQQHLLGDYDVDVAKRKSDNLQLEEGKRSKNTASPPKVEDKKFQHK